jgi:hypothetical protein
MAYENKKQATDPAFGRQGKDKSADGPKETDAGVVLAKLGNKTMAARWDHPYPISAKQDEAELRMRKRR